MGFLFPCLPDEIGRECLVRVELNSHHNLRCVCKSWNAALKSPSFYETRKVLKKSEQRICLLEEDENYIFKGVAVYDPEMNSCKSLPPSPIEIGDGFRCYFVKQKLVLIPDNLTDPARNYVWLYDFAGLKWKQGAKMTRGMNTFASAADEHRGLIYVAGGFGSPTRRDCMIGGPISSASVYNVGEDKWEDLPDMNACMGFFPQGVFSDGKFYVIKGLECFEVFDSYTRSWKTMENRFNIKELLYGGSYVSAFGHIYCFNDGSLIEYDCSQNKVQIVGSLPGNSAARNVMCATMVGNKIFGRKCDKGFCMLTLPSETRGTFKLIDIQKPTRRLCFITDSAATLDL